VVDGRKRVGHRPARAGRPGARDRAQILELQRSRMIAAAIAIVQADGYRALTIAKVIARAKVSQPTFYAAFADRDACFLAAFEHTLARASDIVAAAYRGQADWPSGMRAAVLALLSEMERERGLARLCIVEALAAGPPVLDRRAQALAQLAQAIDGGRVRARSYRRPQPLIAQGVVGAMATLLHTRLLRDDPAPLTDMLGPLMAMIVLPCLGRAAACAELDAPPPRAPRRGRGPLDPTASVGPVVDFLDDLDMRLTYRTVRVLAAVAQTPAASNREIAAGSGISDPAQISKLLARLAGLDLIENVSPRRGQRGTNAWRLTARGVRLQRATHGIVEL
jgi:AcrR family transcriptional regulator